MDWKMSTALWTNSAFISTTTDSRAVSEHLPNITLRMLNDQKALALVPAMVCIGVLMICGFIGNILVCYIFSRKLKGSTQNFLFVCLALFDLLSCCVSMPTEILDMRLYYMFESVPLCKVLRFFVTFPSVASNITLLVIAVDRFRKVCRPLHPQVTNRIAKMAVAVAIAVGIFFAAPTLVIYGKRSSVTEVPWITGSDCSTSDKVKDKLYPLLYEMGLAVAFFIFTVAITVLYICIWKEIKRHKQYMKENANIALVLISPELRGMRSESSSPPPSPGRRTPSTTVSSRSGSGQLEVCAIHHRRKPKNKGQKSTAIAFIVTSVFVLSYVPHLTLIILRSIVKDFDYNLKGASFVLYNIFLRSYFVNSVANPVIYGAMNYKFREECARCVKRLCVCTKLK